VGRYGARCRGRGTYFSNFVAVGPAHSGLSFSPSLSLGIVSSGGIGVCKDGIEEMCGTSAADGACVVESRAWARWSAEFLSITLHAIIYLVMSAS
jgi:hypothetical protein